MNRDEWKRPYAHLLPMFRRAIPSPVKKPRKARAPRPVDGREIEAARAWYRAAFQARNPDPPSDDALKRRLQHERDSDEPVDP